MSDKNREKTTIEPIPSDPELFEWLERLFDGPTEFPDVLDVHSVFGKLKERLGPRIDQVPFAPQAKETKDKEKEGRSSEKPERSKRPSREELVALSNRIRHGCQRDCNEQGKNITYGVHARSFARSDEYYTRYIFTCKSKAVASRGQNGEPFDDGDDDDTHPAIRYYNQKLGHDERMFHAYGSAFEGLLDRQDRALEREAATNERLRTSNERLLDLVEKLQSNNHQRLLDMQWNEMKIKSVEKGLDLAIGLAPPIINQLTGKKLIQTSETPESLTLKSFFKAESAGGKLTVQQADAAFGKHDNEGKLIEPGVLSKDQVNLLWDIANCSTATDQLDRFFPGADLEISQEQILSLQKIFSTEQLAPVVAMIMMRMQNRTQAAQPQQQQETR